MNFSLQYYFTDTFIKTVKRDLTNKLHPNYHVKAPYNMPCKEIKAPVDLAIIKRDDIFLYEFEIHRADPSNNIAKIAYCLSNSRPKNRITIIQYFSPRYSRVKGGLKSKRILSEYLGNTLINKESECIYISKDLTILSKIQFKDLYESYKKGEKPTSETSDKMDLLTGFVTDSILKTL